jgi:hypothetical protein
MEHRIILSSGRTVRTIEENDCFWVFRKSYGYSSSVSGPFPLDDVRFSGRLG